MEIRFAKKEDMHQIVHLCQLHAEHEKACFDPTDKEAMLSKHLFEGSLLKCLVVEIDAEIVGYATLMKQFSTWDADYTSTWIVFSLLKKLEGMALGQL